MSALTEFLSQELLLQSGNIEVGEELYEYRLISSGGLYPNLALDYYRLPGVVLDQGFSARSPDVLIELAFRHLYTVPSCLLQWKSEVDVVREVLFSEYSDRNDLIRYVISLDESVISSAIESHISLVFRDVTLKMFLYERWMHKVVQTYNAGIDDVLESGKP